MSSLFEFDPNLYLTFFLVLIRVSGIFITAPIISTDNIPANIKIYMVILCSMIMLNVVPKSYSFEHFNVIDYALLVIKELMVGLFLGIIPKIIFGAIDLAGTIIGFQMGFSIANVVDPQTDHQVSIIAAFEGVVATLLFLVLDGHHIFFEALSVSYQTVPVGGFTFSGNKIDFLLRIMADLFIIGIKLGSPFIVALLLANVILGFMARSIPQMNIFVVGFPFTIGLGLILLFVGMPYATRAMTKLFSPLGHQIVELLQLMGK